MKVRNTCDVLWEFSLGIWLNVWVYGGGGWRSYEWILFFRFMCILFVSKWRVRGLIGAQESTGVF